jgi:hypothetical protein
MRIEIDLPDWCDERHIYIFAGIELAAYRQYGENWIRVKTERCNRCGKCCQQEHWALEFNPGRCECTFMEHLGDEHRCALGINRPFSCGTGDPMTIPEGPWEECTIRFEERKLVK